MSHETFSLAADHIDATAERDLLTALASSPEFRQAIARLLREK